MKCLGQYKHLNIDEVCRICLKSKCGMIPIKQSGVEKILEESASIQITEIDKNHLLCSNCIAELNKWHDFYQQILISFKVGHWLIENKLKYGKQEENCNCKDGKLTYGANDSTRLTENLNAIANIKLEYIDKVIDSKPGEDFIFIAESASEEKSLNCQPLNTNSSIIYNKSQKENSYECDKCGKHFKRLQSLNDHIKRHYNSRNFACSTCGKTFYKQFDVKQHMSVHTGERPFNCELCIRSFTRSRFLKNHIKKEHTNDEAIVCDVCKKSFMNNYQLKVHMRVHTGEKPYPCSECDKSFAVSGQLKSHIKYKHTKQKDYICSICARAFTAKYTLDEHMRTHTGEKKKPRHNCSTCGKKCSTTTQLKIHIRSQHTGERPFPCPVCNKSFISQSNLNGHLKTHTGEKSFICRACGKAFSTNSCLKIHLRVHTGERPFECSICHKKFSQASTLNTHMRIHS